MSAPQQDGGLARRAARHVIDRHLISAMEVHRYAIRARDLSQSNGVALVEVGNGRGFAAKQIGATSRSGGQQGSPDRELALYRAISDDEQLRDLAPAFLGCDDAGSFMILEGLTNYRRMDQLDAGREIIDPEVAAWVGDALGRWHTRATALTELTPTLPWMLELDGDRRLEVLDADEALRTLVDEILACRTLGPLIERVRQEWTPRTVIHADVRFANIMVLRSPPTIRFIDWESSGQGDPAWDVAGAVQEYVSVGIAGGNPLRQSPAGQPVAALLESYGQASAFPAAWDRLAPFVACRVVMRAIQLANWPGDTGDQIPQHLDAARELAGVSACPFEAS